MPGGPERPLGRIIVGETILVEADQAKVKAPDARVLFAIRLGTFLFDPRRVMSYLYQRFSQGDSFRAARD